MNLIKDFSLRTSLEIAFEGIIILMKAVYVLGFICGTLTFATIRYISHVLEEARTIMPTQNWGKFQFLVPLVVTLSVAMRPLLVLMQEGYQYLSQAPVDLGIDPQKLQERYNFYVYS
jgi:hypothetical protein